MDYCYGIKKAGVLPQAIDVFDISLSIYIYVLPFQEDGPVATIVDTLLEMLGKDVVDNSKSCAEYFEFFRNYASFVSVLEVCITRHVLYVIVLLILVTHTHSLRAAITCYRRMYLCLLLHSSLAPPPRRNLDRCVHIPSHKFNMFGMTVMLTVIVSQNSFLAVKLSK